MNFTMSSFLVVTVIAFTFSLSPMQSDKDKINERKQSAVGPVDQDLHGTTKSKSSAYSLWSDLDPERARIREQILDGWPTTDGHLYMSRSGPRLENFAEFVTNDIGRNLDSYCLGTFILFASGKKKSFALNYDCKTRTAKIFANNQWLDYNSWKKDNLKKLTIQLERG